MENSTEMLFVLQGLNETKTNKRTYFVITLLSYLFTVSANLVLIMTIALNGTLHKPMFIFLCNLSANGIFGVSTFYPKMLVDLLSDASVTPYAACLGQMFLIYSYVFCEITTLAVMAYDRYVAICKPLNYHSIITPRKIVNFLIFTWLSSICESFVAVCLVARLPLCGVNIEKLYCSAWAVIKLSCVDTTVNNIYGFVIMSVHALEATVIFNSYFHIVRVSVRSQEERSKFVHTCLPHLISLSNFSMAVSFDIVHARYSSGSMSPLGNFMSLAYRVVPPVLNPLIYGLKMNQIRRRIFRICSRKKYALK